MKISSITPNLAFSIFLATAVFGQEPVAHGRVVGVTDGDTLKVLVADQKLLRVRFAFCDAPEKKQAFGSRAKQAMSELVFGRVIEMRSHAIDRYGRTVAQVSVDGKDVGLEMIRRGLAWVYERYITEASAEVQEAYPKAQEEAKAGREGLWSDPNAIPPWIFRDLARAHQQQTIASKWIEAHQKSADPNAPSPQFASPTPSELSLNPDDVWVNTKSGKYWKPGSAYFAKTKRGEYMTEKQALQEGFRAANDK
jgi:endonuclease YncB( thermonuclease family)